MNIKEAQLEVDKWIKRYGVRYFNELTNLALLTEEVGELARIISREYGEQSYKSTDGKKSLSEELADIFFVLICLANQTGTDLQEAFAQTLRKKTERDAERHIQNKKLIP